MKQTFTIPEKQIEFTTEILQLNLQAKHAVVHVSTGNSGSEKKPATVSKVIDVQNAWSGSMSGPEVTAFKKGLKLIISTAWEQSYGDITGDPI